MSRVWICATVCAVALAPAFAAAAYPEKPIQVVVAFPAGGGGDIGVRQTLAAVTAKTGLNFIIDNRAGAGGLIGASYAAKAAPDGYTIFHGTATTLAIAPAFRRKDMPYDPIKDFAPISHIGNTTVVILANAALPANNLAELIALAKKQPGKLSYGTNGIGGTFHLTGEWLNQRAGIGLVHVPYKEVGQSFTDAATGRIEIVINGIAATRSLVRDKKLKIIVTGGAQRGAAWDMAPTLAETFPGMVVPFWEGLFAPARTPPEIIDRLNRDIASTIKDPVYRPQLETNGREPVGSSAAEMAELLKSSLSIYQKLVLDAGLKATD
jgi:tripartite-type tricarboxylate transporter receptor subunit TctC